MVFYYSTVLHGKSDVSGQLTLQGLVPAELADEKLWLNDFHKDKILQEALIAGIRFCFMYMSFQIRRKFTHLELFVLRTKHEKQRLKNPILQNNARGQSPSCLYLKVFLLEYIKAINSPALVEKLVSSAQEQLLF